MIFSNFNKIRHDIYDTNDHTYFNLSLVNTINNREHARFITELTQPLLKNPDQYSMAVKSFSLAGNAIPIFTFQELYYYVMLSYNGTTITEPVPYLSFSSTNTRNIFNYQVFIDMINAGFANAYAALLLAEPGAAAIINAAPYLTYDATTLLIRLVADGLGYGWTGTPNDPTIVNILINNNLFDLIDSFENYFYNFGLVTFPTAQLIVKDNGNGNLVGSVFTMTQNYSTLFKWHDITQIVLVSNGVGVKTQMTLTTQQNGFPTYVPILSSFNTTFQTGPDTRGYINFNPFYLTFLDMIDQTPITKMDFAFYYLTKTLRLEPVYLFPNDSASITLVFKHKSILQ